jgi:hypothetical protein
MPVNEPEEQEQSPPQDANVLDFLPTAEQTNELPEPIADRLAVVPQDDGRELGAGSASMVAMLFAGGLYTWKAGKNGGSRANGD